MIRVADLAGTAGWTPAVRPGVADAGAAAAGWLDAPTDLRLTIDPLSARRGAGVDAHARAVLSHLCAEPSIGTASSGAAAARP